MILAGGAPTPSISLKRERVEGCFAMSSCLFALTFDALFVVAAFILVFAIGLGLGMLKRG
jgi:hypothetical protein